MGIAPSAASCSFIGVEIDGTPPPGITWWWPHIVAWAVATPMGLECHRVQKLFVSAAKEEVEEEVEARPVSDFAAHPPNT